jgi:UDP-N-acetylmuramate dehydrogenase
MHILTDISLKPYNTFGINAFARYFTSFSNVNELREILSQTKISDIPPLILGGGSNMLLTKNPEIVLKNEIKGIEKIKEDEQSVFIRIGAGEVWHDFVMHCIDNNWAGVENLSLIPGNAGAAPMQNIGAYGVEIKDVFHSLQAFHLHDKAIVTLYRDDCAFGYRESVFKNKYKDQFVIVSVTLRLYKHPHFNTSYGAIGKELDSMGVKELSIRAVSQAVINIRTSKLPDPKKIGNAGSFFKNPEVAAEKYDQLKKDFPGIIAYPARDQFKLAAGWMIEQCGWKGYRKGDAGVHDRQSLVLVNYGKASGNDIYLLSEEIQKSVWEKFSVRLEREVNII